ncbi:MAG: cation:proton antiporter [Burkholderiales bacterium]|nr:cation:proton antiporter [Burkholderiales bacterium]
MKKIIFILTSLFAVNAFASTINQENTELLLWLAIITIFAIFAKSSAKIGQPFVLGQLILGTALGIFAHFDVLGMSKMPHNQGVAFFAELGSIFLLLEIGLESSLSDIKNAGKNAIIVALLGVIVPFLLGYFIVVPYILFSHDIALRIFFGSMFAVTSTGISVSVFKELGILKSEACQIVLAASVIDDICGLILLSITTGLIVEGNINLSSIIITLRDVGIFFITSIIFGLYVLPYIIKVISKINNNSDTVTLITITFCLLMSYFAGNIGLAFIIGAFIAGLLLFPQLFSRFTDIQGKAEFTQNAHQLEYLIAPYGKIFTPLFFIYAGMQVDIISVFEFKTVVIAILISIVAIAGKMFVGVFLPKHINKWIVGIGMVPRGEIGLIFAITGLHLKVIDTNIFAEILLMIIITSIVTPITINYLAKQELTKI